MQEKMSRVHSRRILIDRVSQKSRAIGFTHRRDISFLRLVDERDSRTPQLRQSVRISSTSKSCRALPIKTPQSLNLSGEATSQSVKAPVTPTFQGVSSLVEAQCRC